MSFVDMSTQLVLTAISLGSLVAMGTRNFLMLWPNVGRFRDRDFILDRTVS